MPKCDCMYNDKNESKMGVRYEAMIPLLVGAIQRLTQQNNELLARVEALENA